MHKTSPGHEDVRRVYPVDPNAMISPYSSGSIFTRFCSLMHSTRRVCNGFLQARMAGANLQAVVQSVEGMATTVVAQALDFIGRLQP